MKLTMLKSKLHRATLTNADIDYEGSITIDKALCEAAHFTEFEQVDVYNITNGSRFTTYVIYGEKGEMQVNGAAARLVQKGDKVIVCSYALYEEAEARVHKPIIVLVDERNVPKQIKSHSH